MVWGNHVNLSLGGHTWFSTDGVCPASGVFSQVKDQPGPQKATSFAGPLFAAHNFLGLASLRSTRLQASTPPGVGLI